MSQTIERARQLLEQRVAELEAERVRLSETLARLEAKASPKNGGRPSTATAAARRRSTRASRGEREQQLLVSIEANPDYRVSDHAREIGVRPQQLYPLLHKLEASGKVTKGDDGYRAAAAELRGLVAQPA